MLPELVITPEVAKVYRPSAKRDWDLLHTSLELHPVFAKKQIYGRALLYLTPYALPQGKLVLDALNYTGVRVSIWDKGQKVPVDNTYDLYHLSIELPRTYLPGDTLAVDIEYTTNTYSFEKNGIANADGRGAYFIDPLDKNPYKPAQLWTQGETNNARAWFPTIDATNERCTQEIFVTVDQRYLTLSNGTLTDSKMHSDSTRTDHWVQDLPHAPYLFFLGAGEFVQVSDTSCRNIPIDYYTIAGYEQDVKKVFQYTRPMLDFFSEILGVDYPWDKYSQMIGYDYTAGAMENTTASLFYEALYATAEDLIDDNWDDIVAHEIFHQWFGDLVTPESWANLSLSESFADYGEYLWYEKNNGPDQAGYKLWQNKKRYLGQIKYKEDPIVHFSYDRPEDMFDNIRYEKGGYVLHMLRSYLGDKLFFDGIKRYLEAYAFKSAEMHQFRIAMEEVSGEDLNWFFNQWFYNEGHPELTIATSYDAALKQVRIDITQEQVAKGKIVFEFPLSIDIYTSAGTRREKVLVKQAKQTFYFSSPETPELINTDATKTLLCTKKENKSLKEWIFQYRQAPLFADKIEALEGILGYKIKDPKGVNSQVAQALKNDFWGIRKFALDQVSLKDMAVEDIPVLEQVVKTDSVSRLRKDALLLLYRHDADKYLSLLEDTWKQDSSPVVLAAILLEIHKADPKRALEMAGRFDSTRNANLLAAIGKVYASSGSGDKLWVMNKMIWLATLYKVESNFKSYTEYIRRQSADTFSAGVQVLNDIYLHEETAANVDAARTAMDNLKKYIEGKLDNSDLKESARKAWETKLELLTKYKATRQE